MQKIARRLRALGLATCLLGALPAHAEALKFDISLQSSTAKERAAKQQLERLSATYRLDKWVQTRRIAFDETTIPHSHPVLTFHARHLDDDALFLSTFIHEQMHWWLSAHPEQTARAVAALKRRYATLPVGYPDGAADLESSYEHLLVICLELDGVRELLGAREEARVLAFWSHDHYRKLYQLVGAERLATRAVLQQNALQL